MSDLAFPLPTGDPSVLPAGAKLDRVFDGGCRIIEGPAVSPDDGAVYFSDITFTALCTDPSGNWTLVRRAATSDHVGRDGPRTAAEAQQRNGRRQIALHQRNRFVNRRQSMEAPLLLNYSGNRRRWRPSWRGWMRVCSRCRSPASFSAAFETMVQDGANGVVVLSNSVFNKRAADNHRARDKASPAGSIRGS